MRKILIPLDGTGFRQLVLPVVERLFPPGENALILMRVVPPLDTAPAEAVWVGPVASVPTYIPHGAGWRDWEATAQAYREELEQERAPLEALGYTVSVVVELGELTEQIVEVVEREQVDLVAMATHARVGFSRLVLGSVAQEVLNRLHVPMLLFHPAESERK